MADEHDWPAWDSDGSQTPQEGRPPDDDGPWAGAEDTTGSLPRVDPEAAGYAGVFDDDPMTPAEPSPEGSEDPTQERLVAGLLDERVYPVDDEPKGAGRRLRSGVGKVMMASGAVLGVLVLAYLVDLFLSWGDVPRGVTVAGVDVGGMSRTAAESKLREELEPRFTEPVRITAGNVDTELDPTDAGLGVDWQGTLEQAGQQPFSPLTRISSLWTEREVGIAGQSDRDDLKSAVDTLAEDELNVSKREGTIKFRDVDGQPGSVEPVAMQPRQGQELSNPDGAINKIENSWLHADGVELSVDTDPVKASPEGVKATLNELVEPAVAAPVEVNGEDVDAVLQPKQIGEAFDFTAGEDGSLKAEVDQETLKEALQPQLAESEREPQDAEVVFSGGKPDVKESKNGRTIQWEKTLEPYLDVIKEEDDRALEVSYSKKEPDVTTEDAEDLGIKEVIGEFSTGDFASDSGKNIRTVAEDVDGAIVLPGETFSLNEHTGPRTADNGYIEAGIIEDGVPGKAVGGGISQFATTLYNAAYFAGLEDAGHTEHSYYIDRYPIAREATVYQAEGGGIDLAFTNDADTGVAIQTEWSSDEITVKIWGTKRYDVESSTSERKNKKDAGEKTDDSDDCEPSGGTDGFTATDTRTLYDADSGEKVRSESNTVTYNPKPKIVCKDDDD